MKNREISVRSGELAENLVCKAFNCKSEQSIGYDVRTQNGYRAEVRSRVMYSDGKHPRLTLNRAKMEKSEIMFAIHFSRSNKVTEAVAIPTKHLSKLYEEYLQRDGSTAHIPWLKVVSHPSTRDVTKRVIAADTLC